MIVIFVGPTLDVPTARAHLPARYLPPAARGDVARSVTEGAQVIGLIDGYFEWTLSVWHKEILWALTQGTHVFGAASMGALRAVELAPFGMRGIGKIFEAFRNGSLEDDDEVAVFHHPAEGYASVSEAMINIRVTLAAAQTSGVISQRSRSGLEKVAKDLFYPDRGYDRILTLGRDRGLPCSELDRLSEWLPRNRIDQKRADALTMLDQIRALVRTAPAAFRPQFDLARSRHFDDAWSERLIAVSAQR